MPWHEEKQMVYPMHTYTDASGEILGRILPGPRGYLPVVYVRRMDSDSRNKPIILHEPSTMKAAKSRVERTVKGLGN